MSGQHPPITCSDLKVILRHLGFTQRPSRSGTSHEQWVATINGVFRKVTVDCPKAPFSPELLSSMARQAGINRNQLYKLYFELIKN